MAALSSERGDDLDNRDPEEASLTFNSCLRIWGQLAVVTSRVLSQAGLPSTEAAKELKDKCVALILEEHSPSDIRGKRGEELDPEEAGGVGTTGALVKLIHVDVSPFQWVRFLTLRKNCLVYTPAMYKTDCLKTSFQKGRVKVIDPVCFGASPIAQLGTF
jgi:hypothetical protein